MQTLIRRRTAASDQSLHCLLRPVCLNTKGYYVISNNNERDVKRQTSHSHSHNQGLCPILIAKTQTMCNLIRAFYFLVVNFTVSGFSLEQM